MPRLIDLIKGRKLPVRVSYGGGWFEVIRHELGACFGFWDNGGPDGYLETDDEWELCPDQPAPTEEVRPGFRKVKMYQAVEGAEKPIFLPPFLNGCLQTTPEDAKGMFRNSFGYVEVEVWVKE